MYMYSQDIADDTDGPHVCGVADGLEADYLGCHELRRAEQDLQLLHGLELAREAEVDDLDAVAALRQAQNVFRLEEKRRNYKIKRKEKNVDYKGGQFFGKMIAGDIGILSLSL